MTFKPLLAATVKDDTFQSLAYPLLWSPKLDGVRTLIVPGRGGCSRKIIPLPNEKVREALSNPALEGLDGECIFGPITDPDVFNRSQRAVMTIKGPGFDEADGKLLVFDDFTNPDAPFHERYASAQLRVSRLQERFPFLKIVPHYEVENAFDLANVERIIVEKGFEGIMVRSPDGRYKFGRSTAREGILQKIKRFVDEEARLVGMEELYRNGNELQRDELGHAKRATNQENLVAAGTMGALVVYSEKYEGIETTLPNGKVTICDGHFKIGTGFTAEQRQDFWNRNKELIGSLVSFKYQESGMKDLPRFPVFKGFRQD